MTYTPFRRSSVVSLFFLSFFATLLSLSISGAAEEVRVSVGRLSGSVAPPSVPGAWPHGDSELADAAFFSDEDKLYRRWRNQKRKPQSPKQPQNDKQSSNDTQPQHAQQKQEKERQNDAAEALHVKAVAARNTARRARLKVLKNASDTAAAQALVETDALQLLARVDNSTSTAVAGSAAALYQNLRRVCFPRASVFPPDAVISGDAISPAEFEAQSILSDARGLDGGVSSATNDTLRLLSTRLSASRRAHRAALSLADPLLAPARARLSLSLRELDAHMRANDEATRAARDSQRLTARRRRHVRAADGFLSAVAAALRGARRKSGGLLTGDAFVAALAAAARLRGCAAADFGAAAAARLAGAKAEADAEMNAEVRPAPLEAATGATAAEAKALLLRPALAAAAAAAGAAWALRALRRKHIARCRRRGSAQRRSAKGILWCIMITEALAPVVFPALAVARANTQAEVTVLDVLQFAQPGQRFVLCVAACAMLALSVGGAYTMGALYEWTWGNDSKKKKIL